MKKISKVLLHTIQHICLVGCAFALVMALLCSTVFVEDRKGKMNDYDINTEAPGTVYEDSQLFNQLLGNAVTDIICYGAIRGQMETDGVFDSHKKIDITAFANRYSGIPSEYITAEYYLEDLIKWTQNGFEYDDHLMTSKEANKFLSNQKIVTKVDFENGNYSGGTVSYLNSDIEKQKQVVSISENMISNDVDTTNDDVTATILKNRYRTTEGKKLENYASTWEDYYYLCQMLKKASDDLNTNYQEYLEYNEYYNKDNSNVIYYIRKTIGKDTDVYSNRTVESENLDKLKDKLLNDCDKYIIYDPENMVYDTNTLIEEETLRYILNGYEYAYPADTQILIGVSDDYAATDCFSKANAGYKNSAPYFIPYICISIFAIIAYLFLLVVLTKKEGVVRIKETNEMLFHLNPEDKIPSELMLILATIVGIILAFIANLFIKGKISRTLGVNNYGWLIMICLYALLLSLTFSFFYYSLVRRIKAGTLWKNSLLRRCYLKLEKSALYIYDNASIVLRIWVPFVGFILMNALLFAGGGIIGLLAALIIDFLIGIFLYRSAQDRQKILKGIQKINDGDMKHQIDTAGLHGDNLVLANSVNHIGDGIRNAVETSMKDERMKADLITNVSHDIKTPLTSIINYVDLIKRENVENPKVQEYIEILDIKSQRLKQLTDDLVEASKISSGNIILKWEAINLVELLNQSIGEFSDKFEEKKLTPIIRSTKSALMIEADSRRIWRVIENLFNNIFKYALSGTRVYIDLQETNIDTEKQVILSILNISANPIKVDTEELTERFIRGDESRTTEGSGLGLSIAKNLTEVQKGKFEIFVDGDLFKVVLTFPLIEK